MDQVLNKVGSYWFGKRASKEIDSIGDDLNVRLPAHLNPFRTRIASPVDRFLMLAPPTLSRRRSGKGLK